MTDHLHYGPSYIKAQAEIQAKENELKSKSGKKQALTARADILRHITVDDTLQAIRHYAQSNYDNSMNRLFDPSKRASEYETTETLRIEATVHKLYVDLFDIWEKEGKEAMKKILSERKGEG